MILDVDGTLVDSNDAHARAWVEAFTKHGVETRFEDVRALIGMGGDKLVPRIAGFTEDSPQGKRVTEERSRIFMQHYVPALRPFECVPQLLRRMKSEGLELAIASSAQEEELEKLLAIAGVRDMVRCKTSSDDAEASKPDPDIVEAALECLKLPTDEVVMLGDTPYDVAAAERAGIRTIALRTGGWADEKLQGAIAIYDDPCDLLASYDKSPLAREGEKHVGERERRV